MSQSATRFQTLASVFLALSATGAQSYGDDLTCASPFALAKRTGHPRCWVQFSLPATRHSSVQDSLQSGPASGAHPSQFCVSQRAWHQWLSKSEPLCANGKSPIRVRATQALLPGEEKKISTTLTLPSLNESRSSSGTPWTPNASRAPGLLNRAVWLIERARESASSLLKPHDPLGILRSLILNEAPNREPLPMLRRLGFVHLISATGIHLYALADGIDRGCYWAFTWMRASPTLGLRLSRALSFATCSLLWLLSGARLGMLRPWILLNLRGLALSLGFKWTLLSPLLLVSGTELLLQIPKLFLFGAPELHFSGQWVYSLAVGGGLIFLTVLKDARRAQKREPTHLETHLCLAVGSWVGVALYEIYHEGMIALLTPLLSLITLPLICSLVYPVTLVALVPHFLIPNSSLALFSEGAIARVSQLLHVILNAFTRLSLLPGNLLVIPKWALFGGGLIAVTWLILVHLNVFKRLGPKPVLIGGSLGILMLRFVAGASETTTHPRGAKQLPAIVYQLDVGQGDAALIESLKGFGMIDTGSKHTTTDVAWLKLFASLQIKRLDWIALTHLDEDHAGGIERLAGLIPIRCVAWLPQNLQTERGKAWFHRSTALGLQVKDWKSDCIPYPHEAVSADSSKSSKKKKKNSRAHSPGNSLMGAVLIPLKSSSIGPGGIYLTAGDAGKKEELKILDWVQKQPLFLQTHPTPERVLKLSHHGSSGSTHEDLIKTYRPTQAWISVGTGNRYGHPKSTVLNLLERYHLPIRRTDLSGTLVSAH